jgi:hypothetical protein
MFYGVMDLKNMICKIVNPIVAERLNDFNLDCHRISCVLAPFAYHRRGPPLKSKSGIWRPLKTPKACFETRWPCFLLKTSYQKNDALYVNLEAETQGGRTFLDVGCVPPREPRFQSRASPKAIRDRKGGLSVESRENSILVIADTM